MSGVYALPQGALDFIGIPAMTKVGPNMRALTATAPVGTVGETVIFPGPVTLTGNWTLGSPRVFAANMPVVTQATAPANTTTTIVGAGPPMVMVLPDARVLVP